MAKHVLILNDDENSLGELIEALANAGYTAFNTTDADDCIDQFEIVKAELLFLSLKTMGALDSVQVVRMDPSGAAVPIIFTGDGSEGIKNTGAAKQRGGDDFLKVPLDLGTALSKVKEMIGVGEGSPVPIPEAPEPAPEPEPEP
ncbi:MAG: hypothetical protein HOK28_21330, partial [Deltaproteobacteria bacterium]|nr:hypothetical protein [Deltaproteobacteria bacterium]